MSQVTLIPTLIRRGLRRRLSAARALDQQAEFILKSTLKTASLGHDPSRGPYDICDTGDTSRTSSSSNSTRRSRVHGGDQQSCTCARFNVGVSGLFRVRTQESRSGLRTRNVQGSRSAPNSAHRRSIAHCSRESQRSGTSEGGFDAVLVPESESETL